MITPKESYKNIFLSSIANVLDVAVYPILMLIATPLFIQKLGAFEFGMWIFVNSIIASLGVLNIGLGDATIKYVSKYRALNDKIKVNYVISTTYTSYLLLVAVVVIIGWVLIFVNSIFSIIDIQTNYAYLLNNILPIAIGIFGLKLIEQIFLSIFKGYERYDISASISFVSKLTILFINIFLVYIGNKLFQIFVATAVINFLIIVVEALILKILYNDISFHPKIDKSTFEEVISFGAWSWAQTVLSILASQIDKFIVVYFAGFQVLTYYSIGLNIAMQLHFVFAAGVSWIFPKISNKVERGERIDILYTKVQYLITLSGLIVIFTLILTQNLIFKNWLGEINYKESKTFIDLFLYFESFMVITIVPYYFLNAGGYIKLNTWLMVFTLCSKILFIPLAFFVIGTNGIVIGQIVALVICIPLQIYFINKFAFKNKNFFFSLIIIVPSIFLSFGFALINFSFLLSSVSFLILFIFFIYLVIETWRIIFQKVFF